MARILITSALPYINGIKHLGNLVGSMLPADVYARFCRAQGHETLYICATDEHGTPAELAALKAGQDVKTYCDEQHERQRQVGEGFLLSYDHFGRSSSAENHALTQHFAQKLMDNGYIEEREIEMIFSVDDGRFLPDRYVEGTCPKCGSDKARGDQCNSCDTLLDPTELINPRSAISGSTNLEIRTSKHLYLLQSKLEGQLKAWVDSQHHWPNLARSIALKWLEEGLADRGITRDLKWGVPVNREGFEDKVFYVWFDAPIEYIGATQEWAKANGTDWQRWWRTDQGAEDVRYVQFMGKDNVAFHTVSFPATLIGSGEPWKRVDVLKAFNWLNWYGGKFSTSERRGVFMDTALDLLPADVWRWYLMANAPEGADTAFTWEQFQSTVNSDLANVLGNFVNRIMKFCDSKLDGKVPEHGPHTEVESKMLTELEGMLADLTRQLEAMEMRKAASTLRGIWVLGNEYLQEAAPWTAMKTNPERAGHVVRMALELAGLFAVISAPFIPQTSQVILQALGRDKTILSWPTGSSADVLTALTAGASITTPPVLFQKIEDEQVADWTARFGGAEQELTEPTEA